jgi:polynucleotide 5'-kinase involved in rRNA processing
MFTRYFQNDRLVRVSLSRIGLRFTGDSQGFIHDPVRSFRTFNETSGTPVQYPVEPARLIRDSRIYQAGLAGRIVSLRDERNTDRTLGIIEEFDEREKKLLIRTPQGPEFEISTVVIGSLKVEFS